MASSTKSVFDDLPRTSRSHFLLHLYAAVFQLLGHLHRLSPPGTETPEAFDRHPFLGAYLEELSRYLPDDLEWNTVAAWWRREISAWESGCDVHLPLAALAHGLGLDYRHRVALMLAGLPEEDSRFGTVFVELQAHLGERRPTLDLVGQAVRAPDALDGADPRTLCRPLLDHALVRARNPDAPRSEWVLEVPPLLWDAIRGELGDDPTGRVRYLGPADLSEIADLELGAELEARLGRLTELVSAGRARSIVLRSRPGDAPLDVFGAVARSLGRGLLVMDLPPKEAPTSDLAGPLATLAGALPVLAGELGPGETRTFRSLPGYEGVVGVSLGPEGGIEGPLVEGAAHLELPFPRSSLRRRLWQRALGPHAGGDLDEIADRLQLGAGYVRRTAETAVVQAGLDGRAAVGLSDVRTAARALGRQQLDSLATHLDATQLGAGGSWDLLVAARGTLERLQQLESRCRHRERLGDHLGPAFGITANRGVRALFSGPSGTGKTLAARLLAAELGMDLYRVDLASVVSKYIGETEKNLHQVLTRAEALDVVLLIDEGDALLGGRTEVRSSNDRYANLETNYLLQRLESFQGIVLVTTNLAGNVDAAFQRRMDVAVPFFPPHAEERWRIFELHLPASNTVELDYLERVALRCALTGGQIRNAVVNAALLALDDGGEPLGRRHLEAALKSEYKKAGGTFPLNGKDSGSGAGLESFAAALAGS